MVKEPADSMSGESASWFLESLLLSVLSPHGKSEGLSELQ